MQKKKKSTIYQLSQITHQSKGKKKERKEYSLLLIINLFYSMNLMKFQLLKCMGIWNIYKMWKMYYDTFDFEV